MFIPYPVMGRSTLASVSRAPSGDARPRQEKIPDRQVFHLDLSNTNAYYLWSSISLRSLKYKSLFFVVYSNLLVPFNTNNYSYDPTPSILPLHPLSLIKCGLNFSIWYLLSS